MTLSIRHGQLAGHSTGRRPPESGLRASKATSSGNNLAGPDSNTRVQSKDLGLSRFHWWLIRVTFRAWNWCYGISAKRK